MKNTPVEPGTPGLRPAGQQIEAIRMDQLHRQQFGQLGQALGLGTGDLELGLATLVLGEADGHLAPFQFTLGKQGKRPLPWRMTRPVR